MTAPMYGYTVLTENEPILKASIQNALNALNELATQASNNPDALLSIQNAITSIKGCALQNAITPEQAQRNATHLDRIKAKFRKPAPVTGAQRLPNRLSGLPL